MDFNGSQPPEGALGAWLSQLNETGTEDPQAALGLEGAGPHPRGDSSHDQMSRASGAAARSPRRYELRTEKAATSRPPEAVGPCRAGGLPGWPGASRCLVGRPWGPLACCRWVAAALAVRWLWPQQREMEPEVAAHRHRAGGADRLGLGIDRWIALPCRRPWSPDTALTTAFAPAGTLRMWPRQLRHGGLWSGDHPCLVRPLLAPHAYAVAAGGAVDGPPVTACRPAGERRSPPGAGGSGASANRC